MELLPQHVHQPHHQIDQEVGLLHQHVHLRSRQHDNHHRHQLDRQHQTIHPGHPALVQWEEVVLWVVVAVVAGEDGNYLPYFI
jgi:hypothetical protein